MSHNNRLEHLVNVPTIIIILGVTGDLSLNKLLPSLYKLEKNNMLQKGLRVLGVARSEFSNNEFLDKAKEYLDESAFEETAWDKFGQRFKYVSGDFSSSETFSSLADHLNEIDEELGVCTHKIFYLAISPDLYAQVFAGMKQTHMRQICKNIKDTRVVIEKPFGKDLKTFQELNTMVLQSFNETQIFRIDHYLAKETVQNIMYFRAANPAFFGSWNASNIESIEIEVLESLGVGSRGRYFDSFGQLKDMIQSHLVQLLAVTLMDLPDNLASTKVSESRAAIIRAFQITSSARGQYVAGVVDGQPVKAYLQEDYVAQNSQTETFASVSGKINGGIWDGLNVKLVSGKRLKEKCTQIKLNYRDAIEDSGISGKNRLIFRIQPQEGITLEMQVKKPGVNKLEKVKMKFDYKDSFVGVLPDAYEKILLDIINMERGAFLSSEELEASWKMIDDVISRWDNGEVEIQKYPAGSNELLDI